MLDAEFGSRDLRERARGEVKMRKKKKKRFCR
jgi:hypothetical protein